MSQHYIELISKRKNSKQPSADEAAWPGTCHEQASLQALESQSQKSSRQKINP